MIDINNRRYIGSKYKLLTHIESIVNEKMQTENYSIADLFGGTGVVAHSFACQNHPTIVNDILYSNVVAYNAWMGNGNADKEKVNEYIEFFNKLEPEKLEENYFSKIYGGKYFSVGCAKKIGYIREELESIKKSITEREYYILLTSLIYATDRVANTVGHFEYFLSKEPANENFYLQELNISEVKDTKIYNTDANELVKQIYADVIYIDPPYNARQYVNFYHVLENLARWEKPTEFEGNSMKFKRDNLKSGYSRAAAPVLFNQLIEDCDCKLIVVSYNNTYTAKSIASINKIQENEIVDILSRKGKVEKYSFDYKHFNAGKTDLKGHQESLFVCEVAK